MHNWTSAKIVWTVGLSLGLFFVAACQSGTPASAPPDVAGEVRASVGEEAASEQGSEEPEQEPASPARAESLAGEAVPGIVQPTSAEAAASAGAPSNADEQPGPSHEESGLAPRSLESGPPTVAIQKEAEEPLADVTQAQKPDGAGPQATQQTDTIKDKPPETAAYLAPEAPAEAGKSELVTGRDLGHHALHFVLPSATGGEVTLESYEGDSNVVLIFYRGFW